MSILSTTTEQQVIDTLLSGGMLSEAKLAEAREAARQSNMPLLGYLVNNEFITDEQLTKVNATVAKIPYVNLLSAKVNPEVLKLLPREIAERYMAVPLGEMNNRLVVAMLDAGNVQAVDFLSNRLARPLKVYAASEAGIRQVLRQYGARLDTAMRAAFGDKLVKEEAPEKSKETAGKTKQTANQAKTI